MSTVTKIDISYINLSELKSYKKMNTDILPDLVPFIDNSKVTSYWKHYDNPTHYQQARLNKSDTEKLSMSIRGLLNKIFDKNYSLILDEIKKLNIDDKTKLSILVDIFFKKIVTERNNIPLFLSVAKDFYGFGVTVDESTTTFRFMLLTKFQLAFENILNIKVIDGIIDSEYFKYNDEIITFVKYLGEMHNSAMIKSTIVASCLDRIFNKINSEETLPFMIIDILCSLLGTVLNNIQENDNELFTKYYNNLLDVKKSKKIKSKEKFMIMDVLDKVNLTVPQ